MSQSLDELSLTLSHLSGSRIGEIEKFSRESVLIGRGRHNDVALDAFLDPTVSTQHAEIRCEQGCWVLYDMGSLNGSFVNGHRVRRVELRNGDEISLGRAGPRLVFQGNRGLDAVGFDSSDLDPLRDTLSESARRPMSPETVSEAMQHVARDEPQTARGMEKWLVVLVVILIAVVAVLLVR